MMVAAGRSRRRSVMQDRIWFSIPGVVAALLLVSWAQFTECSGSTDPMVMPCSELINSRRHAGAAARGAYGRRPLVSGTDAASPAPVAGRDGQFAESSAAGQPPLHSCNCSGQLVSDRGGQGGDDADGLCAPVNASTSRREVLVWYVPGDGDTWQHYDWQKVTTVAVLDDPANAVPQRLVCAAHARGVRVVYVVQYGCWTDDCPWLQNASARATLVAGLVAKVRAEKLDGVNVDIEGLTAYQPQFTALVQALSVAVRAACSSCQVSVDMPYLPMPVYSFTGYNWSALAMAADFLITMNYDMNDFGKDGGFADANSPMWAIRQAMHCILQPAFDQHVPAGKIVMGFPWYAYFFRCDNSTPHAVGDGVGVGNGGVATVQNPCYSHLAFADSASQHSLAEAILEKLPNSSSGRLWDEQAQSPYFDFLNATVRHRVRYDDDQSIAAKCALAESLAVRGVAFWTGNVDYGVPMPLAHQALENTMWKSITWPAAREH